MVLWQKKYKHIIFDLGGVLLRWNPTAFIQDMFPGSSVTNFLLDPSVKEIWHALDKGLITLQQAVHQLPSWMSPYKFTYFTSALAEHMVPLQDGLYIVQLVKQQGYSVYILSDLQEITFCKIRERYNFFELFNGCIISYQVHAAKPDPEIYSILLKKYNLHPAECLFIDDKIENIQGGQKLGIDGIVCVSPLQLATELKHRGILA